MGNTVVMSNTIIKFYGSGCMNCKALSPILESVKPEFPSIEFRDVNVNEEENASGYEISTLPTLVFEKDGKEVGRLMGLKPKSLIVKKISEVF